MAEHHQNRTSPPEPWLSKAGEDNRYTVARSLTPPTLSGKTEG